MEGEEGAEDQGHAELRTERTRGSDPMGEDKDKEVDSWGEEILFLCHNEEGVAGDSHEVKDDSRGEAQAQRGGEDVWAAAGGAHVGEGQRPGREMEDVLAGEQLNASTSPMGLILVLKELSVKAVEHRSDPPHPLSRSIGPELPLHLPRRRLILTLIF